MFQKNDFVICKGKDKNRDRDFDIYARVVDVDSFSADTESFCYLDRYQKFGAFHLDTKKPAKFPIFAVEEFYQPMNEDEIFRFYEVLKETSNNTEMFALLEKVTDSLIKEEVECEQ